MRTVNAVEAQGHLLEMLKEAKSKHETFVLRHRGKNVGVLMSPDDYAMMDNAVNAELLADPEFQRRLALSERQLREGKIHKHSDLKRRKAGARK